MNLVLYAVVICVCLEIFGCAPVHKAKPMLVLPSTQEVEITRLTKENTELQLELAELTHNCSAVLRIFKEADLNTRKPQAKEK